MTHGPATTGSTPATGEEAQDHRGGATCPACPSGHAVPDDPTTRYTVAVDDCEEILDVMRRPAQAAPLPDRSRVALLPSPADDYVERETFDMLAVRRMVPVLAARFPKAAIHVMPAEDPPPASGPADLAGDHEDREELAQLPWDVVWTHWTYEYYDGDVGRVWWGVLYVDPDSEGLVRHGWKFPDDILGCPGPSTGPAVPGAPGGPDPVTASLAT